jgi:hypothetical protein
VTVACCQGAPRDLGRDLGAAQRDAVRAALGGGGWLARLGAWRVAAPHARLQRELRRHFPHQSEWLEGLSLAAGVPLRALLRALAESCGEPSAGRGAGAVADSGAALATRIDGTVLAAAPARAGAQPRRVEPEGRFRSLELALPALPWAQAGVNEAGLAVVALARCADAGAPPTALFTRDCLERFERVDPALEWCLERPAGPGGALLLADATGDLAAVDAQGPARRALRPTGDWLGLGVDLARLAKPEAGCEADVESALVASLAAAAPCAGAPVIVDPAGRRLRVPGAGWLALDSDA